MDKQGRVRNITDLARLAGVSPGTVSRALADSQLIAKKTRERIQELAREHDFRPNVMARNLRIKRAGAIGVLIPMGHDVGQHISDPFFITMLGHLADGLTERGHDLLLSRVIPKDPDWLNRVVDSGRVDGVILIGQSDQLEVIDRVASRYQPMVAWGAKLDGQVHCSVGSDNLKGGEMATRHLIERGCRNFAFLGDAIAPEISERLKGCKRALSEAGLLDRLSILPVHLTAEDSHPAISKWLDESSAIPNGIVAASDVTAMSALRALSEHGVAVPREVHVVGYDDLPFANQTVPPLSTVRQDIGAGARHLIDILFRRIAGEQTESVVLDPQLVVRQSS
ncbi:MAG: LacI family DNA-binding transcriptional regulator [Sphingomonadaceae bacterium]|nr:LacI family DNA-binding transcriptional regulator [Sphingomonadaceae bacterium]